MRVCVLEEGFEHVGCVVDFPVRAVIFRKLLDLSSYSQVLRGADASSNESIAST